VKIPPQRNVVLFCDNYTQVFRTLHMASSREYENVTVVISQFESLYKFFLLINEKAFNNQLKVIFPEPYVSEITKKLWLLKPWYLLKDIAEQRRYFRVIYDTYFTTMEKTDAVFGPGYAGLQIALFPKLVKKHRVIYFSPEPAAEMVRYLPHDLKEWVLWLIFKLIFGWSTSMGKVPNVPYLKGFPLLPDKVIKTKADTIIEWQQRTEMMKSFDQARFRIPDANKYKILYFHDDFVEAPYSGVDQKTVNTELNEVFQVLSRHFKPEKMATKFTPASAPKPRPQIGEILPAFIPAELLYNDNIVMYLSIASGAIFNVEKGTAVSLLEMITFKDDTLKKQVRKALYDRKKSNILFPKSLEEFEQIVIKLKNQ
jgi:hypothetical protein